MSNLAEDNETLEEDAVLDAPLKRVSYEAGMLLGLEATRDEQAYHRKRLNRHQYWMHGSGTLAGMLVSIDPATSTETDPILTRVIVGQGAGIDGLGREVLIHENHCIDLGDWLKSQTETGLREGYDEGEDLLWIKVSVRYQECDIARQPVLSRKLNLSTDAVQPSRKADSISLSMRCELPEEESSEYQPWGAHNPVDDAPAELTQTEQDMLDELEGAPATAQEFRQLQLHSRLLHALNEQGVSAQLAVDELERGADILLAQFSIDMADLNTILDADENDQLVNPNNIHVNNLVRPFLVTASQLAYLHRSVG